MSQQCVLGNKLTVRCAKAKGCFEQVGQEQFSQKVWTRRTDLVAFIQEGKMLVAKDWFTMAVSRGTIKSKHLDSKDIGIGSRTQVLGDIFASQTFSIKLHMGVAEKCTHCDCSKGDQQSITGSWQWQTC